MLVKILNKSSNKLPEYANLGDAGMDIRANETSTVYPGETKIIKTGLFIEVPVGYELQVRPRSGISAKTKMRVANSPGTIDSNYRGEIGVIVDNLGGEEIKITAGDRIAQIVFNQVPTIQWREVQELSNTTRNAQGFGSTGVK